MNDNDLKNKIEEFINSYNNFNNKITYKIIARGIGKGIQWKTVRRIISSDSDLSDKFNQSKFQSDLVRFKPRKLI